MRWYTRMGRRVWPYEIRNFLRDRRLKSGPTVAQFWGAAQDGEEESMSEARPERRTDVQEAA
jgi:anaerobic magnesium-protoporphyrin IX monomethyl ester cyclase